MDIIKKSLFFLILLLLAFPAIQENLHLFKSPPLNGYFVPRKQTGFSVSSWFTGAYQDSCSYYFKENIGYRNDFVRLYNQADYSFFSIPHAAKIILGKKGYLFSDEYITAYLGSNFTGKTFCDEKVRLLKTLQDLLWNEKKIFLVVILTPDKGTYYSEYIPDRFLKRKKEPTNYNYYAAKCAEAGINMIDFNRWFLMAKDTSRYPLYPKTGIHWTTYGAVLAADSLLKYLHSKLNLPLPWMVVDGIETSSTARDVDDDIAQTMNLIWKIPHPVYAYPNYHFTFDTTQKKPSALFIGDSFYWNWYPAIIKSIFSKDEFWYYNKDVYLATRTNPTPVSQVDVAKVISRQKIVILMQVNGANGNIGYGFTDLALSVLDPATSAELRKMEDVIRNNYNWMRLILQKAVKNHISVNEQLKMDALYMLDLQKMGNQHNNK